MKKVAILQSNYIPWKGYFDIIASVDEFIIYDDVQFTKNDWRNRNKIKTPRGLEWLTIPVGQNINRRIRDVLLSDSRWQKKHWGTICANYIRSPYFREVANLIEPLYTDSCFTSLTCVNRSLIDVVCDYLGISTKITYSWEYSLQGGRVDRLVSICEQSGANTYVSGPSARGYIDETLFSSKSINIEWVDYEGYPEYQQCWGSKFEHGVTILDLLFNCGQNSHRYMKNISR